MSSDDFDPRVSSLLFGYSLEATPKDVHHLEAVLAQLTQPLPVFIPSLPGGRVEERIAAAAAIRRLGLEPVPHVAARRVPSLQALESFLERLSGGAAATSAFVIAGDIEASGGPFPDALAIIRSGLLQRYGFRRIGIAGHPDGHPQIAGEALGEAMKRKLAALADAGLEAEIVTQFAFDADPVLAWLRALRREGVQTPVRIGIPGPASVKTLLRFAARCGVGASSKVLNKYGLSLTRLFGSTGPENFLAALVAGLEESETGIVRAHIFPFGGFAETADWLQRRMSPVGLVPDRSGMVTSTLAEPTS